MRAKIFGNEPEVPVNVGLSSHSVSKAKYRGHDNSAIDPDYCRSLPPSMVIYSDAPSSSFPSLQDVYNPPQ